jgi:hypothetical protein
VFENTPFIHELARLIARISSAEIPESLADVLTAGPLFALHKLSKDRATTTKNSSGPAF